MYYHISPVEGLTVLEPRVPRCAEDGEPIVPRVCAAPTIAGCLTAFADLMFEVPYYIYQVEVSPNVNNVDVQHWPDGEVNDARETGEVWYLSAVPCECLGTLDRLSD